MSPVTPVSTSSKKTATVEKSAKKADTAASAASAAAPAADKVKKAAPAAAPVAPAAPAADKVKKAAPAAPAAAPAAFKVKKAAPAAPAPAAAPAADKVKKAAPAPTAAPTAAPAAAAAPAADKVKKAAPAAAAPTDGTDKVKKAAVSKKVEEVAVKADKAVKAEKAEKAEKVEKAVKVEKVEKAVKAEKVEKVAKVAVKAEPPSVKKAVVIEMLSGVKRELEPFSVDDMMAASSKMVAEVVSGAGGNPDAVTPASRLLTQTDVVRTCMQANMQELTDLSNANRQAKKQVLSLGKLAAAIQTASMKLRKTSESASASTTTAAAAAKLAAQDEAMKLQMSSDMLALVEQADAIQSQITSDSAALKEVATKVRAGKKLVDLMHKASVTLSRLEAVRLRKLAEKKAKNTNTGLKTLVKVSPELTAFLGLPDGTLVSRCDMSSRIHAYIREHNLKDADKARCFVPDAKLRKLFRPESTGEFKQLNIQNLLTHHFPPSKATLAARAAAAAADAGN